MGWSNSIPNPFIVGGGGLSGEIIVLDAAGRTLITIGATGFTLFQSVTGVVLATLNSTGLVTTGTALLAVAGLTGVSLAPAFPTYTQYLALDLPGSRQFQFLYNSATDTTEVYSLQTLGVNFSEGPTQEFVPVNLTNGQRPIYYSKPDLPNLVTKVATIGPSVGTTPMSIAASPSLALDGSTSIQVTFQCSRIDTTVAADVFIFSIRDNGVTFDTVRYAATGGIDGGRTFTTTTVAAPAAGGHVFDIIVTRIGGTGTISIACSATALAQLTTQEFL